IDRILALDSEGFYHLLAERHLSICGGGPIVILMTVAQILNVNTARLLSYSTSGDVTGDRSSVVGYASICFSGSIHD
ncbi:AmmeMemoRadiSam system protein B, partial [Candidatus Bipolaricaulota bacterium]|nr:AmmeMemoRadiSam system protein B [Candidatus Bipolaricaulota bacterium]